MQYNINLLPPLQSLNTALRRTKSKAGYVFKLLGGVLTYYSPTSFLVRHFIFVLVFVEFNRFRLVQYLTYFEGTFSPRVLLCRLFVAIVRNLFRRSRKVALVHG